jgi:hypothetical protein
MIQSIEREGTFIESHHRPCDSLKHKAKAAFGIAKLIAALVALILNGALFALSVIAVCVGSTPASPLVGLAATTLASFLCAARVLFLVAKDRGWV